MLATDRAMGANHTVDGPMLLCLPARPSHVQKRNSAAFLSKQSSFSPDMECNQIFQSFDFI